MRISINGALHSYELTGSGPNVTLLHTVGLSTRQGWCNQLPVLSKRYRVLTYDIRGLGESELGTERLGVRTFVRDLEALLVALEIKETVLVGASLGGSIAQAFTVAHPEMVQALVLVSTTCKIPSEGVARLRERNERIRLGGMRVAVDEQIHRQFSPEFIRANPDVIDWYRAHYLANDPEAYIAIMEDQAILDQCEKLTTIQCLTLIITGEDDASPVRGRLPRESASMLRSLLPQSRLVVIPHARHYPHIDHPELFNLALLAFLSGPLGGSGA